MVVGDRTGGHLRHRLRHRAGQRRRRNRVGQRGQRRELLGAGALQPGAECRVEAVHHVQRGGHSVDRLGQQVPAHQRTAPDAGTSQLGQRFGAGRQLQVAQVAQEPAEHVGGGRRLVPSPQRRHDFVAGLGLGRHVGPQVPGHQVEAVLQHGLVDQGAQVVAGAPRSPPHGRLLLVLHWKACSPAEIAETYTRSMSEPLETTPCNRPSANSTNGTLASLRGRAAGTTRAVLRCSHGGADVFTGVGLLPRQPTGFPGGAVNLSVPADIFDPGPRGIRWSGHGG